MSGDDNGRIILPHSNQMADRQARIAQCPAARNMRVFKPLSLIAKVIPKCHESGGGQVDRSAIHAMDKSVLVSSRRTAHIERVDRWPDDFASRRSNSVPS